MRRLPIFFFGMLAGALLLYGALNYHLIRAKDGLHLVPKVEATLAATYVDIRGFGPADWTDNADVALALLHADRRDLLESSAVDSLRTGVERLLQSKPANR